MPQIISAVLHIYNVCRSFQSASNISPFHFFITVVLVVAALVVAVVVVVVVVVVAVAVLLLFWFYNVISYSSDFFLIAI